MGRAALDYGTFSLQALENVHTVLTDTGWREQESDSETAGAWSATAIQFNDTPTVTVTDTAQYGASGTYFSGWQTDVITESLTESVNGSGQSLRQRTGLPRRTDRQRRAGGQPARAAAGPQWF
jgi:hypothetical protein